MGRELGRQLGKMTPLSGKLSQLVINYTKVSGQSGLGTQVELKV